MIKVFSIIYLIVILSATTHANPPKTESDVLFIAESEEYKTPRKGEDDVLFVRAEGGEDLTDNPNKYSTSTFTIYCENPQYIREILDARAQAISLLTNLVNKAEFGKTCDRFNYCTRHKEKSVDYNGKTYFLRNSTVNVKIAAYKTDLGINLKFTAKNMSYEFEGLSPTKLYEGTPVYPALASVDILSQNCSLTKVGEQD